MGRPNILLGITGSVASVKCPELACQLSEIGEVKVISTKDALHFYRQSEAYNTEWWSRMQSLVPAVPVLTDQDEWSAWKVIGDPVMHIELRNWADIFVLAPLSANTLAKLANGLCDNLLTCVMRAWDCSKPVVAAPAMNTHMYLHPFTAEHLDALRKLGVLIVDPTEKELACGDIGTGALAAVSDIVRVVRGALTDAALVSAQVPSLVCPQISKGTS